MRGETDRLMILTAPRHGKSELASRRFPAFYLGHFPDHQFISFASTSDFAADFGRDVRDIIDSIEYRALFQTRLAEDSQARGKWHTEDGGIYYAVGVGGSVLGKGAHVALIDDPFASMADAKSETSRKTVIDWYRGTVYNRLMPGGKIILINHRMHEEDLSGYLLAQEALGGDRWEIVNLPAIDAAGCALWPEAYDLPALERIRRNMLPADWSALYMQQPTPDEGTFFKKDWFRFYAERPQHLRTYGASDWAVTSGDGDYTVHGVVGVDPVGNIYVLDVWRNRVTTDFSTEAFIDMVVQHEPMAWAVDKDLMTKSVGPFVRRRMDERRVGCYIEELTLGRQDKAMRARSFQAACAMGRVYFPANAPWWPDLERELLAFDAGKHDDQVDMLGLIGRLLDTMVEGHKPEDAPPPVVASDAGFDDVTTSDSWTTA